MTKSVAILCILTAVDMVGFGLVIPLIPFFAQEFGASPFEITFIIASFPASQLLMSVIWGRVSDRVGRRPIIVLGLCASAVSYVVFANSHDLLMLLLSRIMAGGAGATVGVAQAFIADSTDGRQRAQGIGYLGAAYGVGVVLGPLIGAMAIGAGFSTIGWIAAAICGLNALVAQFLLPEPKRVDATGDVLSISKVFAAYLRPPMRQLAIVYFLVLSAFDGSMAVYALLYQANLGFSARDIALLWSWAAFVQIFARGLIVGPATRRWAEAEVVAFGGMLMCVGLFSAPFADHWVTAALATTAGTIGSSLALPTISSLISKTSNGRSLGALMGSAQIIAGSARIVGPLVLGLLYGRFGGQVAFATAALASAAGGVLAFSRQVRRVGNDYAAVGASQ